MHSRITPIFLALLLGLTSCAYFKEGEGDYPVDPDRRRLQKRGKITGDEGIVLFGGKLKSDDSAGGGHTGIGINSYLWRATLDTIAFMPLTSADPFGGVVITDWYEDPQSPGERFKLHVVISDRRMTSTAVKVSAFKQELQRFEGETETRWRDVEVNPRVTEELENKILTRARQLRAQGR